jgi:hypothetical protein
VVATSGVDDSGCAQRTGRSRSQTYGHTAQAAVVCGAVVESASSGAVRCRTDRVRLLHPGVTGLGLKNKHPTQVACQPRSIIRRASPLSLIKGSQVNGEDSDRSALTIALLTVVIAPLSGIAINYATSDAESVPAIVRPLQQWPWLSGLLLTVAAALLVFWTWCRSRANGNRGVSPAVREQARVHLAREVRRTWIDSILVPSQPHGSWQPGLLERPRAVAAYFAARIPADSTRDRPVPSSTSILDLADQYGLRMLILGDTGAGKTTALLTLTRELLAGVETAGSPVPVVFLLSRWPRTRTTLHTWLIAELQRPTGFGARESPRTCCGIDSSCRCWMASTRSDTSIVMPASPQ